jgi:alkanesulfonate monooxygenase SsuD/methylene tetrahydromethanopterin reductase-like flavin-dependent oxidoreductase (luciferase family)
LWPRPYQTPHPPVWIPSMGSRETIEWASAPERKYAFLVTFSSEAAVVRYLNMYRETAQAHGYDATGSQLGWAVPLYVADTDARAREEAKAGIETLFNNFLPMPWEMLLPPGYTSNASLKATMKIRTALGSRARNQTIDELIANGTAVIGSPKTVLEKIERVRDQTGVENLITMLQFGVMPDALAVRNMELFASEVMPKLR